MRPGLALTAVAAAAAALAAGCGSASGGGDGKPIAAPTAQTATTPAGSGRVDAITWALPYGEPTTLDPVKTGDYSPNTVLMNVCEPLMRMNADYSITPGLAESYRRTAKSITYKLRSGVTFSDGKPMTAADVVASLERNLDAKLEPINGASFALVKSIKATAPLEVTVTFRQPDALFNEGMATEFGAVSEASAAKTAGRDYGTPAHPPVCTGPYKVASWKAGSGITLQARDDYWDAQLKPKVKTVDFKFITDSSTLTSALLSGSIDGAYEAPATSFNSLRSTSAGRLYLGPSTQVLELAPASAKTPMANHLLTQALDKAIDRTALVRNVYHGAATPNRAVIPPGAFGQGPAKAIYQQAYDALPDNSKPDLAGAKALVQKAGSPSKTMVIALPAGEQSELQIATFVQASAKAIGLNFKLKQMPPTEFSSLFYDPSKRAGVDLVVAAGYLELPDPLSYAQLLFPKDALFNWTGYDDPQVNDGLQQARTASDETAEANAYVKAQAVWEKERIALPIATPYERLFMNKRITGAPASFAYINMPWAAMIGAAGS